MIRHLKAFCAALALSFCAFSAVAVGWPANYSGVMLQAFYWDSYTDSSWTNLENQADELSEYFSLIWVPNSGKCSNSPSMGYDPVYWFTNHNSDFGTEAEIRHMIQTFKAKGTGIIEDVVINHRNGKSNWTDFPAEQWNGQTWQIGLDGICRTDEVNNRSDQAHGTGANDTGDDFDGARDLDHTNANVRNNCKNYCKFLLDDMGYVGFRLDMVKGYSGQYTKIYNQYSKPQFCVGEYWDGYDAIAAWIEATARESAAFDFPFKYAVRDAFAEGNMTKLAWAAAGNTNNMQPAGMIHYGYNQFAVTFIDNHDTYRNDWNKFNGNVVAANAFMLCSPGTPCVFLPHWKQYKVQIKKLIRIRKAVGITNTSSVRVLQLSNDCYMAEVTGNNGKLVVKIGSAMVSPSGYSNSDIQASGTDYCIWSKVNAGPDPEYNATVSVAGNFNSWSTSKNATTTIVNNCATIDVENYTNGSGNSTGFKIVVDGSTWYANGSKLTLDQWYSDLNTSAGNMTLPSSAEGKTVRFTFALDTQSLKVSIVEATPNPEPDPDPDPIYSIVDVTDAVSIMLGQPNQGLDPAKFDINKDGEISILDIILIIDIIFHQ